MEGGLQTTTERNRSSSVEKSRVLRPERDRPSSAGRLRRSSSFSGKENTLNPQPRRVEDELSKAKAAEKRRLELLQWREQQASSSAKPGTFNRSASAAPESAPPQRPRGITPAAKTGMAQSAERAPGSSAGHLRPNSASRQRAPPAPISNPELRHPRPSMPGDEQHDQLQSNIQANLCHDLFISQFQRATEGYVHLLKS